MATAKVRIRCRAGGNPASVTDAMSPLRTPVRQRRAFTLVELLVVIAIIAALTVTGFAVFLKMREDGRRLAARTMCQNIVDGVNRFYNDYSVLPGAGDADVEWVTDQPDGVLLVEVLMAREGSDGPKLNAKDTKYITPPEAAGRRGGVMLAPEGFHVLALYDPWGGVYHVALDVDLDGRLDVQPKARASKTLRDQKAACWSDGPDGAEPATVGESEDDVVSW